MTETADSKTLSIELLQTQLVWEQAAANCEQMEAQLKGHRPADILLLPEMFNSGFSMSSDKIAQPMDGATVAWMRALAIKRQQVVVGSLAIREGGDCFNRMIWMPPMGEPTCYDKRHLFAMAGEHERYRAGLHRGSVHWRGWTISLQVCYDLRFPVWCRQDPADPYDLMLLVANWPSPRALAWNRLIPARAIENQAYVAALNRVGHDARGWHYAGDSQVCDDLGNVLFNFQADKGVAVVAIEYQALRQRRLELPFQVDADEYHLHQG